MQWYWIRCVKSTKALDREFTARETPKNLHNCHNLFIEFKFFAANIPDLDWLYLHVYYEGLVMFQFLLEDLVRLKVEIKYLIPTHPLLHNVAISYLALLRLVFPQFGWLCLHFCLPIIR